MNQRAWRRPFAIWSIAASAYMALSCVLAWPLPIHLRTHLLGDPAGDTGVYVWNTWIFNHELLRHGRLPFSTTHLFSYSGGADFSLHNYTPLASLAGAPLIDPLGVVGAFNVVLLALVTLAALSVFALARRLGMTAATAWLAGALFIASPVMTARETAHLSLVNAAPLPLFLLVLLRALASRSRWDAIPVGVVVALATYSDAYYGVYCIVMGAFVVGWRFVRVTPLTGTADHRRLRHVLELVIALIAALLLWRAITGRTAIVFGGWTVGLQTAYTPVLLLVGAAAIRLWLPRRPILVIDDPAREIPTLARRVVLSVAVCLVLLAPVLVGVALRIAHHQMPEVEVFWRSSPRGVDLLAYLVPNPNHAWFGGRTRDWLLPTQGDAFPELIGSFSIVAFALILAGVRLGAVPTSWLAFTALFVALSLGPFAHVAGVNTYVIGPWGFLRYVPIVGLARSPARFAIVATLGFSLLAGYACDGLRRRYPLAARKTVPVVGALLVFELFSAPRPLYSAAVPEVYRMIATMDDEAGRLLELPTGIRDGTSSIGNFSASAVFFQTHHRRPLIGGYLSRVSEWRKRENNRVPMLRALFALSEGRTPPSEWLEEARRSRDAFLRRGCVRYVVINKLQASSDLQRFAIDALRLNKLHDDGARALYEPADPPRCETEVD